MNQHARIFFDGPERGNLASTPKTHVHVMTPPPAGSFRSTKQTFKAMTIWVRGTKGPRLFKIWAKTDRVHVAEEEIFDFLIDAEPKILKLAEKKT